MPGIGPATWTQLQPLVTVGGAAPVAPVAAIPSTEPAPAPATPAPAPVAPAPAAISSARVNINTADAVKLEDLPGIGPSKAAAILDDRSKNGPFATCQDLGRVPGIGPATITNMGDACTTQ